MPLYSPEAVLHQETLPSSWQGFLNIAIITHLFYRLVFSVISPPHTHSAQEELYEHSQLLPGSARLDNPSTEQGKSAWVH